MNRAEIIAQMPADLACPDCPAEVRITEGTLIRARVIHSETCPWYRRHLAKEPGYYGRVPCGTVVTHRGPYKRDPAKATGWPSPQRGAAA